jgi:hypothetical protein
MIVWWVLLMWVGVLVQGVVDDDDSDDCYQ